MTLHLLQSLQNSNTFFTALLSTLTFLPKSLSKEKQSELPPVSPLGYLIGNCFSNFNVQTNHVGILLKRRFWLSGAGVGLRLCIADELQVRLLLCKPHSDWQGQRHLYLTMCNASLLIYIPTAAWMRILAASSISIKDARPTGGAGRGNIRRISSFASAVR